MDSRLVIRTSSALSSCDIIEHNIAKYSAIIKQLTDQSAAQPKEESATLEEVFVFADNFSCGETFYPHFHQIMNNNSEESEESYSIEVQPSGGKAVLYGGSVWAVIRALETFAQLLYWDHLDPGLYVNVSRIWDRPRFVYRSIMLDTGRHFLPIPLIIKNLVQYIIGQNYPNILFFPNMNWVWHMGIAHSRKYSPSHTLAYSKEENFPEEFYIT